MITKMQNRSLALAAATIALGLGSQQALATSQTGHASAAIVQAIVVTENTQMNFGFVIPPAGAANVVLTPANVISGAGFTFVGGNVAGRFTATGTASQPAVITFSSGDTLTGPGTAMAAAAKASERLCIFVIMMSLHLSLSRPSISMADPCMPRRLHRWDEYFLNRRVFSANT